MRGNCFLGLIRLRLRGVRGRVVAVPSANKPCVPHLMIRGEDGWYYHFRRSRDLLPGPLRVLWFEGLLVRQRRGIVETMGDEGTIMPPLDQFKILLDYLRGVGGHSYKCALRAALTCGLWAVELLPGDDHVHNSLDYGYTALENAELADRLANFIASQETGGPALAGGAPLWLIPLILEIIRRLAK